MSKSSDDSPGTTTRSTSSRIAGTLELRGVSKAFGAKIKSYLRLANPAYQTACRANPRARFALSEWIRYYVDARPDGPLTIPRGVLGKLSSENIAWTDDTVSVPCDVPVSTIRLREYQEGVAEVVLTNTDGIFRLGTGWGKTILGLRIHELLRQKTLIIVPRLDLLDSFILEYEKFFPKKSGRIQGKICDIQDFTVATIQSLRNAVAAGKVKDDDFSCLIVDECHLMVPEKSRSTIEFFRPKHRYALSGTLDRGDGQGDAISWIFGKVLVDKELPGMVPSVRVAEFRGYIPTLRYDESVTRQVKNEDRNKMIVEQINMLVSEGRKVLCLVKRCEHAELLGEMVHGSTILRSTADREDRKETMRGLKESTLGFNVIIGTFSLIGVGTDVPSLSGLVIAGDLKSSVLSRQSAGRLLRLFEGKKDPVIVDIYDSNSAVFRRQGRQRHEYFRSLGWSVK